MATILGTPGNDRNLNGTSEADAILGFAGYDTLNGFDGNDYLDGGNAADILNGGNGDDTLDGGNGNDQLSGGDGNDTLRGGSGSDDLRAGSGNDQLSGGNDGDSLNGGSGADRMSGGGGNDGYVVDNVGDVVLEDTDDAAGGEDGVLASVNYTLGFGIEGLGLSGSANINGTGNGKNNHIQGNNANNVLSGMDGDDVIYGNLGNDLLDGGTGADDMNGEFGNDTYIVDNVGDSTYEGSNTVQDGVDTVKASVTYGLSPNIENLTLTGSAAINGFGNGERNVITGNSAANQLLGLDGNDHLHGNGGNDLLFGGNGNDLLIGDAGADFLTGGLGADIFRYQSVNDTPSGSGRDIITDFDGAFLGVGDKIDLSGIDANALAAGNQAFTYIGNATFTAAGQLRYNTTSGILSGSTDADAASEFQILLVGIPALTVGGAGTDVIL
jgi:Ca2+-binding RTX toxin-like protein